MFDRHPGITDLFPSEKPEPEPIDMILFTLCVIGIIAVLVGAVQEFMREPFNYREWMR